MPTATRRARATKPAIHVQAQPATTTVAASGGKSATGDVRPAASQPETAKPAPAVAKPAPKEKAAPKGLPILPVRGAKIALKDADGVVATRATVGSAKAPAIRLFQGKIMELKVGSKFDSHHGTSKAPCGEWTVIAEIIKGEVKSGKLPEGTKAFAANAIIVAK